MNQITCQWTGRDFLHRWGKPQMTEISRKEIFKSRHTEFVLTWDGCLAECLKKFSKTVFGVLFRTSSLMPSIFARGVAINLQTYERK